MAQQIATNVYQINSMDPIPLASVGKIGFPTAGIMIRPATNPQTGLVGIPLATGVTCYGNIQVVATGSQYLVVETAAQLVTLSNA